MKSLIIVTSDIHGICLNLDAKNPTSKYTVSWPRKMLCYINAPDRKQNIPVIDSLAT